MTQASVATLAPHKRSLIEKFAARFSIESEKLLPILKATAFKVKDGEVTNEQMAALLIVADQYKLNPFTREIFAFPDKQNGIVPVVSVDGWARIINEDVMFNGLEFRYSEAMIEPGDKRCPGLKHAGHEWIEVVIYRKDREKPIVIREYLEEVYREPFKYKDGGTKESAWQTHTKRFHRHKTLIQGSRIAFGFAGLFDEDEAERIIGGHDASAEATTTRSGTERLRQGLAVAADATVVEEGKMEGTLPERDKVLAAFAACADVEVLDLTRDGARGFEWTPADQAVIDDAYNARRREILGNNEG